MILGTTTVRIRTFVSIHVTNKYVKLIYGPNTFLVEKNRS